MSFKKNRIAPFNESGMTLLEVMISILILGVIMLTATKIFSTYIKSRNQSAIAQQEVEEMSIVMNEIDKRIRMGIINKASCPGSDVTDLKDLKICDNNSMALLEYFFDDSSREFKDIRNDLVILQNTCGKFESTNKDGITMIATSMCKTESNCENFPENCKPGTLIKSSVSLRSGYEKN